MHKKGRSWRPSPCLCCGCTGAGTGELGEGHAPANVLFAHVMSLNKSCSTSLPAKAMKTLSSPQPAWPQGCGRCSRLVCWRMLSSSGWRGCPSPCSSCGFTGTGELEEKSSWQVTELKPKTVHWSGYGLLTGHRCRSSHSSWTWSVSGRVAGCCWVPWPRWSCNCVPIY